jgi:hypothetical protein
VAEIARHTASLARPHLRVHCLQQPRPGKDLAVAGGKAASEAVSAEFRGLKVKVPDITFNHELDMDLGNREVQLKHLPGVATRLAILWLFCRKKNC